MNIVIPYKKDRLDGIELRYCLRGIEKHLSGWDGIVLVGSEIPSWYKGSIVFTQDVPLRKQFSIFNKLLTACNSPMVNEEFLYFNDDHFLLKPLHVSEIKNWYEGTIKDHIPKAVGKYKTACENTMNAIDGGKYFDIHTPCIFNKAGIRDLSHLNWAENEYIIKSLYLNVNKGDEEEMEDCKINQPKSKKEIEERIKDRLFFSTGHNGLKPPMIKVLEELYPEKSSYESA